MPPQAVTLRGVFPIEKRITVKIIGAEIRFGYSGMAQLEAKIVPFDIVMPAIQDDNYGGRRPTAEVTFHTTLGDVTARVELPHNDIRYANPSDKQPVVATANEAINLVHRQLEK